MPGREFERHSGTGGPIKEAPKKGGAGQGNWGADSEEISAAVAEHNAAGQETMAKKKRPESMKDLQDEGKDPERTTFDAIMKTRERAQPYRVKAGKSSARKKDRVTAKQRVTDDLFAGDRRGKKRRVRKKTATKTIKASYSFKDETMVSDRPEQQWGDRSRQQRSGAGFGSFGRGARVFGDAPAQPVQAYEPAAGMVDGTQDESAPQETAEVVTEPAEVSA